MIDVLNMTPHTFPVKIGVLFDFDEFLNNNYEYEELVGAKVTVDYSDYSKVRDYETLLVLKDFDSEYFWLTSDDGGESITVLK